MASKQVKTVPVKVGGSSPSVTMMSKTQLPVDPKSQETPMKDFKELLTELMSNQTAMIEEKLEKFEEEIKEIRDVVAKKHDEIREDIIMAVSGLSKNLIQLDEKVEEISEVTLNLGAKLGEVATRNERLENEVTMIQYRSMEFALRLRGMKENNQENLRDRCAEIISTFLEVRKDEAMHQIDKAYRVNSWIARQRQLPRDVVIYFIDRRIRNDVLQASYKNKVQISGQEIQVMKEIPPKMLRDRKDFAFLVEELRKQQLIYRWDAPIGLIVTYGGERHRLNSVWKAKDFYYNVLKAGRSTPSREATLEKERIQQEGNGKRMTYAEVAGGMNQEELPFPLKGIESRALEIVEPKDQRLTRATYKQLQQQQQQQKQTTQALSTQDLTQESQPQKSEAVGGGRGQRATYK